MSPPNIPAPVKPYTLSPPGSLFNYIQPINDNFMFRLGYRYFHPKDRGLWMWGQPTSVTERIKNMYILMDARF
jgi:hypothetical protein